MKSAPTSEVLDLEKLTGWLDERGLGEGDMAAESITVGASNLIFDLRRGDAHWVLRRPPTVPVSPTVLQARNGWLVSDGRTLVAVYAGAAGDDPAVGRVAIVRQDLASGTQTVQVIGAGHTGAQGRTDGRAHRAREVRREQQGPLGVDQAGHSHPDGGRPGCSAQARGRRQYGLQQLGRGPRHRYEDGPAVHLPSWVETHGQELGAPDVDPDRAHSETRRSSRRMPESQRSRSATFCSS